MVLNLFIRVHKGLHENGIKFAAIQPLNISSEIQKKKFYLKIGVSIFSVIIYCLNRHYYHVISVRFISKDYYGIEYYERTYHQNIVEELTIEC